MSVASCSADKHSLQEPKDTNNNDNNNDWSAENYERNQDDPNGQTTGEMSNISDTIDKNCQPKDDHLAMSQQYVELDPTLQLRNNPSLVTRSLIFTCTAIYSLMPLASVLASLFLFGLLFTKYYLLTIVYFTYVYFDRKTWNSGGRRFNFVYNSPFWKYLAAYFPIRIRHPSDFELRETENYILSYHPHGISAFGSVTFFATNGLGFARMFPKITSRFMVHETSFLTPVMRETFSFRGDCSVNSKSIDHFLAPSHPTGNLLTIVVGGLAEADLSDSEILKIVVAQRKGFIKKALVHGTNIIPCIAFGENSVFHKVNFKPTSIMHKLEATFYQLFGFKHPIYYGRAISSGKLHGVMPYKKSITVCMGSPIMITKVASPSQEDIDMLHVKYMSHLRSLYDDNRDLCSKYDRQMLLI